MASRTANLSRPKGLDAGTYIQPTAAAELQTTNVALFTEKNPFIRIFYASGWLAIPVYSCKWSSTVFKRHANTTNQAVHLTFSSTRLVYHKLAYNQIRSPKVFRT
jgi:hypothetical protein